MSFSNPAADAQATAGTYVAALLELLGDRDPFDVQEQLVGQVRALVAHLDRETLRRPEAPGKWSPLQVVAHLVDTERVYGYRMRMIRAEDRPPIPGYDQDAWARELGYQDMDPGELLEELEVLRRGNLRFLHSLSEEDWNREGLHSERGPESLRRIFHLVAAHDLVHLRQIQRTLGLSG